jgi:hypothetical protein
MCGCGKFKDDVEDRCGIVRGVMEMHTRTHCMTKKVSRWRRRVFGPIAGFFQRIAGEDHGALIAWVDQRQRDRAEALRADRREASRAAMRAAMFGSDT